MAPVFPRTASPFARRVAIYALAADPDARDADLPSLTGRDLAAIGLEMLDRRSPEDAHNAARICRVECGVSL